MTFFSLSTSKTSSTTPIQQYSLFNLTLLPSPLQISWPLQVNVKRWQFGYTGKCHKGTGSLSTRELRKLHVFCLLYKNPLPLAILPDHLILNCKYLTSKKSAPCSWHLAVRLCIDDTSFYGGRGLSFRPQKATWSVCRHSCNLWKCEYRHRLCGIWGGAGTFASIYYYKPSMTILLLFCELCQTHHYL